MSYVLWKVKKSCFIVIIVWFFLQEEKEKPEKEKTEESRRPEVRVIFTADSDNDEARAQMTNLLHEKPVIPVIRRTFPPMQSLLFGFIILCLIFVFALIFYLVFKLID